MEQLIKKAWKISAKDLSEPWYFEDITVMADTRGEARSKGLNELFNQGAEKIIDRFEDSDLKYTDIIAKRDKDYDITLHEGKEMKRKDLKSFLWQKERDEKALQLTITNPNDLAVVYAGCYSQYWGANHSGYSSSIIFAGKYTTQQAYEIIKGSDYSRQEEVKLLDAERFNKELDESIKKRQSEIDRLKTYII